MELIYQKELEITPNNTNKSEKLTLSSLLDFLQKIAGEHADKLKFGITNLNEVNDTWVLSHLKVKIARWPKVGEKAILKTWPKGIDRLFAIRDFILYDTDESILVRAASYWLVIDRKTKRPKMPANTFKALDYPDLSAIEQKLDKIPEYPEQCYTSGHRTTPKEIDINGHVNNVCYADWIIKTLQDNIKKERDITCFEINYLSEVFVDEMVNVELGWSDNKNNLLLGSLKRNNKEVCRVKISFE